MKNKFIRLAIFITASFFMKGSYAQSTLETQLMQLNLNALLEQPVDSLLSKIPIQDSSLVITSGGSMMIGAGLLISYNNTPYCIEVDLGQLEFLSAANPNNLPAHLAWPFQLLRKEKVAKILIFKNLDIIKESTFPMTLID